MTALHHMTPHPDAPRKILWVNRYCLLDTSSGASISARQMLLQLKRRGWQVRIIGCTAFDSERGMTLLKPHLDPKPQKTYLKIVDPDQLEHTLVVTTAHHANQTTNAELNHLYSLYITTLDEFKPDFVFFYGGNAFDLLIPEEARVRGIKSLAYLVNPNYVGSVRWCRDVDLIVTDSKATAGFYKAKMQLEVKALGTFIDPSKVIADNHERKHLLFINPALEKGGAFVAQLALLLSKRRPDIMFEVVESRGLWAPMLQAAQQSQGEEVRPLPNVVLTPNQADMRAVYARARLLLVPSLWWESGARVLAEAMLNGIPALVTDHGGSPEMIEDGGIKIKLAPELHQAPYNKLPAAALLEPLLERMIALFDNEELYRSYCERAYRAAQRLHNIESNTDHFIAQLSALAQKPAAPHPPPPAAAPSQNPLWREICSRFPMFTPNSAGWSGGLQALAELTTQSAPATLQALQALARQSTQTPATALQLLSALALDEAAQEWAAVMAERFNHYGSDKTRVHGYERLYAWLLCSLRQQPGALLEIGLGTNNLDTPSNMGAAGKPGASVRAFRDLLPLFQIFGADVDRRILFQEERLRTYYADQSNGKTLQQLSVQIGTALDLIIDDGLHAPHSNLNTLLFALDALKPGGHLVIEDITLAMLPIWQIAAPLVQAMGHQFTIFQCPAALVVLVRKSAHAAAP